MPAGGQNIRDMMKICPDCDGSGYKSGKNPTGIKSDYTLGGDCPKCGGNGRLFNKEPFATVGKFVLKKILGS